MLPESGCSLDFLLHGTCSAPASQQHNSEVSAHIAEATPLHNVGLWETIYNKSMHAHNQLHKHVLACAQIWHALCALRRNNVITVHGRGVHARAVLQVTCNITNHTLTWSPVLAPPFAVVPTESRERFRPACCALPCLTATVPCTLLPGCRRVSYSPTLPG